MGNSDKNITLGIELIDDINWMGGTLYLQNLAICLSRLPAEERLGLRLLGTPKVLNSFFDKHGLLPGFEPPARRTLFDCLLQRLGFKQKQDPIDIVYPGFGPEITGAKTVRWIPDFQHRYLPKLFSEEEIKERDRSISNIAARSGVVVLSSETAAIDFKRFFPDRQVRTSVWPFCSLLDTTIAPKIDPASKYGLPDKYLYLPNQFWAHKNHITVFKALARLKSEHGLRIPLVCTGAKSDRRNPEYFSNLVQFIKNENIADQVHLLGLIDREDQVSVLRFSAAVVQPSLFEGWSTVVEDVRATGRPIFLSDLPVHREQSPDYCSYFSPKSDKELATFLLRSWEHLSAGPDLKSEDIARKEMVVRILNSARAFREIIQMANEL